MKYHLDLTLIIQDYGTITYESFYKSHAEGAFDFATRSFSALDNADMAAFFYRYMCPAPNTPPIHKKSIVDEFHTLHIQGSSQTRRVH